MEAELVLGNAPGLFKNGKRHAKRTIAMLRC